MSVISRSSRYRLCSSEGSPSSSKLISDIHTPPAPIAYKVARSTTRAGTGGHRSLPSCGTTVQHYGVRRRRFLIWNQSHSPRSGSPPSGSAALFSRIGAFPKKIKILLLNLWATDKLYLRIQPIIFEVRFLKWHAAGRDTHYFLKTPQVR